MQTVIVVSAALWAVLTTVLVVLVLVLSLRLAHAVGALQGRFKAEQGTAREYRVKVDQHSVSIGMLDNGNRKLDNLVVDHSRMLQEMQSDVRLPKVPT